MTAALFVVTALLAVAARLRPLPAGRTAVVDDSDDGDDDGDVSGAVPTARPIELARRARWSLTRRRQRIDPAELAVWCDGVARAVRGGDTLHRALCATALPACAAEALTPAVLALERGASVRAAVDEVAGDSPHLDLVVVVLRACADNGGGAAEPIDRAAGALRQRAALAAERATQSAQARLSAVVMTLLPGAMLLVLLVTSAAVRATVLSPLGVLVLTAGACLNLAGWAWMRRIIGWVS